MSPVLRQTLEVFIPPAPPGLPSTVRKRVKELGPGQYVTRGNVRETCGSEPAANHFIDHGTEQGVLVPTAWGEYRVADEDLLQILGRLANPVYRRFAAWARYLPEAWGGPVLFMAPRLWRDTDLNVTHPLPVIPFAGDAKSVAGSPPQWDAFFLDVTGVERWDLRIGGKTMGTFQTPTVCDTIVVLRASLDPRWSAAAADLLKDLRGTKRPTVNEILAALHLEPAPRGQNQKRSVGAGPPHRYRLMYPKWYGAMMRSRLPGLTRLRGESDGGVVGAG